MKQTFHQGDIIFREGDPGDCMYAVCSGRVGVFAGFGTENEKKLAELKTGDFFGEMGLIENTTRSATVTVLEDGTELEQISENSFMDYFEQDPDRVFEILRQLSLRLRSTTKDYLEVCHAISEVLDREDKVPFDPELNARLVAIQSQYYLFTMSGMRFY